MINRKIFFGALFLLIVVVAIIVGVLIKQNQSSANYSVVQKNLSQQVQEGQRFLQEIISFARKTAPTVNESTEWKTYNSKYLGISFKYPPRYIIREYKNGDGIIGQLSGSVDILPDLPNVREALEMRPGDGYIPLHMKIGRSKKFESAQFSKNYLLSLWRKECCFSTAMFFGANAVVSFAKEIEQGIGVSEIIEFPRDKYIYSIEISSIDSKEVKRIDYYKILSTIEFVPIPE